MTDADWWPVIVWPRGAPPAPYRVVCSYPAQCLFRMTHWTDFTRQLASLKCSTSIFQTEAINRYERARINEESLGTYTCVYYNRIKRHLTPWPATFFFLILILFVTFIVLLQCKKKRTYSKTKILYHLQFNRAEHIPPIKPLNFHVNISPNSHRKKNNEICCFQIKTEKSAPNMKSIKTGNTKLYI